MYLPLNNHAPDPKWRIWALVAFILIVLFGLTLLSGCVTEKQRAKICATCPSNNTISVTTKDSVSVKDSLAKIPEKDGGYINFSFAQENEARECDSIKAELLRLQGKPFIKHYNGVTSSIKSDGKKLTFDCRCDSLEIAFKNLRIEHWALINSSKEDKIIITKCEETWWQVLYRWGFWIGWPIIILYSGYRGIKFMGWIKKIMP